MDECMCIDLKCTHYDGDRCTLGFCDRPDEMLDWLDWCYANNLDPEEELFYERADCEHDREREDEE